MMSSKAQHPPRDPSTTIEPTDGTIPRPAAARPTGKHAPTDPPKRVDPAVQAAAERVRPAAGYGLVRAMMGEQRATELDLPAGTIALLESASVRILALHHSDDLLAREFPVGSVVFASLEGLAPILGTFCFLLPLDRIQGAWPTDAESGEPMGFHA
jgi:hypothetical protein